MDRNLSDDKIRQILGDIDYEGREVAVMINGAGSTPLMDLINECGIEKRLLRRLRDNENVEIFSLDRICTVLNCDLDDIVEYVPNNPDIIEDAKTAQKEAAASHPVHTPSK